MNDGDMFATLFRTCDETQIGRVRVSKIIQFLQQTTQSAETSSMNLQYLQSLLDPEGSDTEIDYDTYIQRISIWAQSLRQDRISPERHIEDVLNSSRDIPGPVEDEIADTSTVSTDSIEGYGGDLSSRSLDPSELSATVAKLQNQIQKISREKEELLRQFDLSEDTNSQLKMEIEEQKRQLKTSQSELGRVKQELNDVQLSREVDNLKALHMIERNEVLEQTRLSLESSISDSKEQLAQRTQELEQLEETNRALSEKLETLQNQLSIVGEGGSFSLDRSLGNTEELLRLIDELKSEKEAAVKDKDTFEQGLLEAKQENERLKSALDCQTPMLEIAPTSPVSTSTPFKMTSLEHEMTGNMDSLPGSIDSQKENDNSLDLTDSSLSSSLDHFSLVASQAHAQFRQKHELALKQITELTALDPARYTREEGIRAQLEEDEMSFRNKLSHLITSKQNADKKLKKLHSLVSRYKAEKQELVRERNDAVDRLEGYVRDAEARSKEIADLKGSLAGEQFKNQNLHRELNDNKRELEQLKDENQTLSVSAEEWGQHQGSLEQRIHELQSCLQDTEMRHGSADDQVVSLRDENEMLRKTLECEKSRITELENALLVQSNRHNKELHDVWQILEDSRRNEVTPQQDIILHSQEVTGFQVKELLIQQLQTLKPETFQQQRHILDMSAVSLELDQTSADADEGSHTMTVSNGKDLQTSLQESVGCQTELSWEHEPMMPGYIEIGCLESSEDIDTDVDSWGAPKGSSSPVAKDAPSALATKFELVLSQVLSEKTTLRKRIDQQAKAFESTETNFTREVEDIRQTVEDFQSTALTKEEKEMCSKLMGQCDVLKSIVSRLARKAAAHSALKQEERLASRFDDVFRYVKCLQGEIAKVSDEIWSGQNVMADRSVKTSVSSLPDNINDHLSIGGGQDLVEAKLRLERLTMDVQKCEKDIDDLDKRVNALAALPRGEVPKTTSQRSLWSYFQSAVALLVLFGLLLFLAIGLSEHIVPNGGRSFLTARFLSYHQGTPPT